MAGVARHDLPSAEAGAVERRHHLHHPARRPLHRVVVGVLRPVAAALVDVAIRAVQAERRGEEPHRAHELVDGNALEHLDVLEDLFRHRRPRRRRLAARPRGAEQPRHRRHAELLHFQLSIAFRWSDSGPISASSMRRPFRSVTLARMACENALGAPGSVAVAPRCLERRDRVLDVRRFQAEVIDAGGTLRVGLLQLEERGLADLQVDGRRIPLRVAVAERFLESHLLHVERRRIRNARHAEPDVVQHDAGRSRRVALRHRRLNSESAEKSGDEQSQNRA